MDNPIIKNNTIYFPTIKRMLECNTLGLDVVSCQDSAMAKGIPLSDELKSLVLNTSKGLYLLHTLGDKKVDFRKVKKFLNVDEAYLASPEMLNALGVRAGTVCPFINNLWSLPQLLSLELKNKTTISTNAGVLNKYIIFDVNLLFLNPNMSISDFVK